MILKFTVPKTLTELPLRVFLRQKGVSLGLWRRLKHNGIVTVNGEPVNLTRTILTSNDEVVLTLPEETDIIPVNLPLDIVYEDDYLLIINKPANQLVHPVGKDIDNTVGNAVMGYYKRTNQPLSFHPVHRLDRNTTGLVLIAKQPNVQHILTTGAKKLFNRHYLAIIPGTLTAKCGMIDAPISRKQGSIIEQTVSDDGKPAITHYEVIDESFDVKFDMSNNNADIDVKNDTSFSLLRLTLDTGRTHQIRVHLAHLGYPLIGDDLYGGKHILFSRQALHACQMEIKHPLTGELLTVKAPLPSDFQKLLEITGLKLPVIF